MVNHPCMNNMHVHEGKEAILSENKKWGFFRGTGQISEYGALACPYNNIPFLFHESAEVFLCIENNLPLKLHHLDSEKQQQYITLIEIMKLKFHVIHM